MSTTLDQAEEVLGPDAAQPSPYQGVLPIPGAWAASAHDPEFNTAIDEATHDVDVALTTQYRTRRDRDEAILKASSEPLIARASARIQAIKTHVAQLKAAEEARAAADRRAAAEADAAARAAAAAAPAPKYRTLLSAIHQIRPEDRDALYLKASETLLPIALGGVDAGVTIEPRIKFNEIFTNKLVDVCRIVYGAELTGKLQRTFSKKNSIRDFFELSTPGTQCGTVLNGLEGPIKTHCWICGVALKPAGRVCDDGKPGPVDCEHRLDVVLALVTTGLYDGVLHGILVRMGRASEYMDLLREEYAYAHAVCNRIKDATHFVHATVVGDVSKTVNFAPDQGSIGRSLRQTFEKVDTGFPGCQPPALLTLAIRGPTWDGKYRTNQPTVPSFENKDEYLRERVRIIAEALTDLTGKLTQQTIAPANVCMRLTRGLLFRAIFLAPALTKEHLWDSLEQPYRDALEQRMAGGRRHRTPRRKRTRKSLRGGAKPTFEEALFGLVETIVCTKGLVPLFETLVAYAPPNGADEEMVMKGLDTILINHGATIAAELGQIDWATLDRTARTLGGQAIVEYVLGVVLTQPPLAEDAEGDEILGEPLLANAAAASAKRLNPLAASASGPPEDKGSNEPARAAAASASASPASGSLTVMTSAAPAPGFVTPTGKGSRSGSESMRTEELLSAQREAGTPSTSGPGSPIALAAAFAAAAAKPAAANSSLATLTLSEGMQQEGGLRLGPRPDWL